MATYTKEEIGKLFTDMKSRADKFDHIKPRNMNPQTLIDMAKDAETIAEHAASKDMHFIATCMLAVASKMNRLLILRLTS